MLELGEASEAEHAAIEEYAHKSGVGVVVAVGEEMTPLVVAARLAASRSTKPAPTLRWSFLLIIAEGDVILFKGSNGSGVWRVADALLGKESQMLRF